MAIAGFSAGEGNKLRKAMGRKNAREELLKWHERFCEGAKNRGYKVILRRRYLTTSAVLPISGFARAKPPVCGPLLSIGIPEILLSGRIILRPSQ